MGLCIVAFTFTITTEFAYFSACHPYISNVFIPQWKLMWNGGVLGDLVYTEISLKPASGRTVVSENKYIYLKIDLFRMVALSLLESIGTNVYRRHFWYTRYHLPPLQSCSKVAECWCSFLFVLECPIIYTCCPMIASIQLITVQSVSIMCNLCWHIIMRWNQCIIEELSFIMLFLSSHAHTHNICTYILVM